MGLKVTVLLVVLLILPEVSRSFSPALVPSDGDSIRLNWNDLDLTGAYFKKHTSVRLPAWPFYALGAAGVGVAGYYLFQGSPDLPSIEARDDVVFASCLSSVSVNVLVNDIGEGLVVAGVSGVPSGIVVEVGSGGLLQIDNVGSASFSFSYTIRDVHGQRSTGRVSVEVQVSALLVVDDAAQVAAGGSVAMNVLSNDTGVGLRVVGYGTPVAGSVEIGEGGELVYVSSGEYCGEDVFGYTVEDGCGQRGEGEVRILILDEVAPQIVCPPRYDLDCGQAADPAVTGIPQVSDDCDTDPQVSYADTPGPGTCPVSSVVTRRWTVRDASGNESSCQQTIRYIDRSGPVITCPGDRVIACGSSLLPSATGQATAVDDCTPAGQIKITYQDNTAGLNQCGGTGVIVRTWTAEDGCGNKSTCTQRITLRDDTPPVISCPANITIGCDVGINPSVTGQATAVDQCSGPSQVDLTYIDAVSGSLNCQGAGQVIRTWVATDACGNTSSCVQTIQVTPISGPSINCPSDRTIDCDASRDPSATGRPTGSTSCSIPGELSFTYTDNAIGLVGCNGTGILVRNWTVTDPCNLSATCTQLITIRDTRAPDITCPPNIDISCRESYDPDNTGWATAIDNCGTPASISLTYTDVVIGNLGCTSNSQIRRTWRATDACNNFRTCEQRITVLRDGGKIEDRGEITEFAPGTTHGARIAGGIAFSMLPGSLQWYFTRHTAIGIEIGSPFFSFHNNGVYSYSAIPAIPSLDFSGMLFAGNGRLSPYLTGGINYRHGMPFNCTCDPLVENPGLENRKQAGSLQLGVGLNYALGNRWYLQIEPRLGTFLWIDDAFAGNPRFLRIRSILLIRL